MNPVFAVARKKYVWFPNVRLVKNALLLASLFLAFIMSKTRIVLHSLNKAKVNKWLSGKTNIQSPQKVTQPPLYIHYH